MISRKRPGAFLEWQMIFHLVEFHVALRGVDPQPVLDIILARQLGECRADQPPAQPGEPAQKISQHLQRLQPVVVFGRRPRRRRRIGDVARNDQRPRGKRDIVELGGAVRCHDALELGKHVPDRHRPSTMPQAVARHVVDGDLGERAECAERRAHGVDGVRVGRLVELPDIRRGHRRIWIAWSWVW